MIRARILHQRASLDSKALAYFDHLVLEKLQAHPLYQQSQKVACYVASRGEVPTHALLQDILCHKSCYLPVITDFAQKHMVFRELKNFEDLASNAYGLQEPVSGKEILVEELDLMIMPVVAFDAAGHRLGMGAGFYDRALAGCTHPPYRLGLAYDFQEQAYIKAEPWDIILNEVVVIPT